MPSCLSVNYLMNRMFFVVFLTRQRFAMKWVYTNDIFALIMV
jgi:hypothetical protein